MPAPDTETAEDGNDAASAPPAQDAFDDMAGYAETLGVTPSYVDGISRAWVDGRLEMAQIAGFPPHELDAVYLQAMDLVRRQRYGDAANVFLLLAQIDRKDIRFLRGLALAFHCLHEFGWSHGVCEMALALDSQDTISLVLQGEAILYLEGKRAAHKHLTQTLTHAAKNSDEQLYLERARQILAKLRVDAHA